MRSAAVSAPAVLVLTVAWLRLEEPAEIASAAALAGLALAPALVRPWWGRLAVVALGAVAALSLAFTISPSSALPRTGGTWVGEAWGGFAQAAQDLSNVALPFDPGERPELHGAVLVAVFGFSAALTLAVLAQRGLLATAVLLVGAGWPATLVAGSGEILLGGAILAAALWLIVATRRRAGGGARAVLTGLVVVALSTVAAGASVFPQSSAVDWQGWGTSGATTEAVSVRFVWDASYSGIEYPEKPTVVLRVRAQRQRAYWRASTLDLFTADRWLEQLVGVAVVQPDGVLPDDPLLPAQADDPQGWLRHEVEIVALQDSRLPAAAQPVAIESSNLDEVGVYEGNVLVRRYGGGQRYTVSSYVARPTPGALERSKPEYPDSLARQLEIDRARFPAFGAPGRAATVASILRDPRYPSVAVYRPLWRLAQRIAGAEKTPYGTTLALERWLRAGGGFTYEEQPPRYGRVPPLLHFATRSRQGYCQHFAGTMALMLRMLGIPSRVAVGFTSGAYSPRASVWIVTDHQAHAWVEAWFAGHGWLAFDPTPGRGRFAASYTLASDSAEALAALGGDSAQVTESAVTPGGTRPTPSADATTVQESGGRPWLAVVVATVVLFAGAVGLAKAARRRVRYLTRDPRLIAGATRAELEDWLRDQGMAPRRGASLGELRGIVEARLGVSASAYAGAAGQARYGRVEVADRAARDARRELRRLIGSLRARVRPGRRLRGYFSLRSLVPAARPRSGER